LHQKLQKDSLRKKKREPDFKQILMQKIEQNMMLKWPMMRMLTGRKWKD
jgi:hypothetical protein